METKLLEAILVQLAQIAKRQSEQNEKLDKFILDLSEFSERFEEIVQQLEAERRLDIYGVD